MRSRRGRFGVKGVALAGLVALVLVIAVTAWASRKVGTDQAIADAQRVTWVSMRGIVEPALDDGLLTADADALDRLDQAVRESVLRGSLVRVKVWRGDGTILYADEPRLIGERFDLGDDELEVLDGGGHVSQEVVGHAQLQVNLLLLLSFIQIQPAIKLLFLNLRSDGLKELPF